MNKKKLASAITLVIMIGSIPINTYIGDFIGATVHLYYILAVFNASHPSHPLLLLWPVIYIFGSLLLLISPFKPKYTKYTWPAGLILYGISLYPIGDLLWNTGYGKSSNYTGFILFLFSALLIIELCVFEILTRIRNSSDK